MTIASRPVLSFDHHNPGLARNPYDFYASVRDEPIFWSPLYGGFWVFTDYESVRRIATDDATFLSGRTGPMQGGVAIPAISPVASIPIEVDSPDAERLRKILMADLAPRAVEQRAPAIRAMVGETIDSFIAAGRCDLMRDLAIPVPARTIMHWLGLDQSRWQEFVTVVHTMLHSGADIERIGPATAQIAAWVSEAMTQRRRSGHRDDLISKLMQSLPDEETSAYAFTLIVAGLDTTSAAIGNALVQIDRHANLRARLLDDPDVLPQLVEEILRHDAPLQMLARTAARDVEIGGHLVAAGDRLLVCWAAANRDPAIFPDPDVIVPDRTGNRHLAFGVGLHRCLGSNIARSTMRIALEEILRRMPDFRLTDLPVTRYPDAAFIYSPVALPAEFAPRAPRAPFR